MNQSFKNCFMVYWIVVIVFANIPLVACSVMEIQTDSIHRRAATLLVGWIFQAIIACLGGAFWYLMVDGDNRRDQQDEKKDIETGKPWHQVSSKEGRIV